MSENIAPEAATGFRADTNAYERGRPSYPAEALRWLTSSLALGPDCSVLDVGAGTGKMTALLAATGSSVVAVEPVAAMRSALTSVLPSVPVLDGTGASLPAEDSSIDALVVAQAFHWMAPYDEALAEFRRVLRPRAAVAVVWNSRDARVPWVAEMSRIFGWTEQASIPTYDRGDENWPAVFSSAGFSVSSSEFAYSQPMTPSLLVDRVASVSYVATMRASERAAILERIRVLGEAQGQAFDLPNRTFVHILRP